MNLFNKHIEWPPVAAFVDQLQRSDNDDTIRFLAVGKVCCLLLLLLLVIVGKKNDFSGNLARELIC
jgi:hypothetical protein